MIKKTGSNKKNKIKKKNGTDGKQSEQAVQYACTTNKSFCGGPGGGFFKNRPLAAGGKHR
jgi:hypothetical protein